MRCGAALTDGSSARRLGGGADPVTFPSAANVTDPTGADQSHRTGMSFCLSDQRSAAGAVLSSLDGEAVEQAGGAGFASAFDDAACATACHSESLSVVIAGRGNRTLTPLRERDFESRASANSATPAAAGESRSPCALMFPQHRRAS